jgi:membrane-associated protein
MQPSQRPLSSRFRRAAAYTLLVWLALGVLAPAAQVAWASSGTAGAAAEQEHGFFMQVIVNLFNSRELMRTLAQPQYTVAAFVVLNLIVFVETGLLIGFFLPGDSLLITAGVVAYAADWPLGLLLATLSASAIIGDSVGYSIGFQAGPKIFNREKSWFFNKEHLTKAQEFYVRHGGKTIVIARFMPLIRTFAPVVAGAGRMDYKRFLFFNVFGGIGWVFSMILLGYYLTRFINPLFAPVFGEGFDVKDHIEKVIVLVVFLSISPALFMWLKGKLKKKAPAPLPEPVGAE